MILHSETRVIAAFAFILSACAGLKGTQQKMMLDKSYCNPQAKFHYTGQDLPRPFHSVTVDTLLTNRISQPSLKTANAIGMLDLLSKYASAASASQSSPSIERKMELIELRQRIYQRINIASLEISAVASELDCEEERADQFAYYLKEREDHIENKLIIGSIIVGAVGAITAEIISNNDDGNAASTIVIGTSLVEATLGVLMLTNQKKIEFLHPVNPLKDIWTTPPVSDYYPPSVWHYLTYTNPDPDEKSLAKLLKEKWLLFGQTADVKDKNKDKTNALFFGDGGLYRSAQLKIRADMLDQVESYITLMKQDLKTLSSEVENLSFGK